MPKPHTPQGNPDDPESIVERELSEDAPADGTISEDSLLSARTAKDPSIVNH